MNLPFKHSAVGVTIFTEMSALAAEVGAINLSQGFPDFSIDDRLADLLHAAASHHNQYAPMPGLPMLRQAIANDLMNRYQSTVHPDQEITVTPGATYGIFTALASFLEPGDDVLVLEPAYDSYIPNIEMLGARALTVPLTAPHFSVDWQRVQEAVTPRTRAIMVNTPHNPTGAVWDLSDWQALVELAERHNLFVVSDEVYEQLVFDQKRHLSAWQHEALRNRSFVVFSFGKVFHITGWKVGYVLASPPLTAAFRHIHQFLAFSVNTPAQHAISQYLALPDRPDLTTMMQAKRDFFLSQIRDLPFTIFQAASGSYFQLAGYEAISDLPDREFAQWLTREYGVATIPVSPFYRDRQQARQIRFCFAKKEETLRDAALRLGRLANSRSPVAE